MSGSHDARMKLRTFLPSPINPFSTRNGMSAKTTCGRPCLPYIDYLWPQLSQPPKTYEVL